METVKLEFISRITMPGGKTIERVVEAAGGLPAPEDFDLSSEEAFLQKFDLFEKAALAARNKIAEAMAESYLYEIANCTKSETLTERIIESEIGRIRLLLSADSIPGLKPKERIWSRAFTGLCLTACSQLSYRKAADWINAALRRDCDSCVKPRTLADFIESCGNRVSVYLNDLADKIIEDKYPIQMSSQPGSDSENDKYYTELSADECCYISIDGIGVKQQKPARKHDYGKSARYVENSVIHIEYGNRSYLLTAIGMESAFRMLLAFLLENGLTETHRLVFFADGARDVKNGIEKYFSFYPYTLILDWYHLKKKCKELISSSVKGTIEQKKEIIDILLQILWTGDTEGAIAFLTNIPKVQINSERWLCELAAYLDRKRTQIVCYALRRSLGLRISSNRVEKANDMLVAQRQKNNGMSWSQKGSGALAVISMMLSNGEADQWLSTGTIRFSPGCEKAA